MTAFQDARQGLEVPHRPAATSKIELAIMLNPSASEIPLFLILSQNFVPQEGATYHQEAPHHLQGQAAQHLCAMRRGPETRRGTGRSFAATQVLGWKHGARDKRVVSKKWCVAALS